MDRRMLMMKIKQANLADINNNILENEIYTYCEPAELCHCLHLSFVILTSEPGNAQLKS